MRTMGLGLKSPLIVYVLLKHVYTYILSEHSTEWKYEWREKNSHKHRKAALKCHQQSTSIRIEVKLFAFPTKNVIDKCLIVLCIYLTLLRVFGYGAWLVFVVRVYVVQNAVVAFRGRINRRRRYGGRAVWVAQISCSAVDSAFVQCLKFRSYTPTHITVTHTIYTYTCNSIYILV